jgi:hypothetical protein
MKYAGWAGAALILATNALALLGIAQNRSGTPESWLVLSERELWPERSTWAEDENSGVALQLDWKVAFSESEELDRGYGRRRHDPTSWLNAEKLSELGFDVSKPLDAEGEQAFSDRQLPRDVILVLEFDGPAQQAALERARRDAQRAADEYAADSADKELKRRAEWARERLNEQEHIDTRLYVIDAGLDREALRARHPDRTRVALLRGQVRTEPVGRGSERRLRGYVESLSIESIHVDLSHRAAIAPLLHESKPSGKPSEWDAAITLAFGQRLEPWITGLSLSKRDAKDRSR